MKKPFLFIFLAISMYSYSQNAPTVRLKDSSNLKLTNLKVDVNITGNFATTTYDMKFYNGLDRTLEGELEFPLGEGQSVSKFAMDVNKKLREAVVVEKELARVAFESTVRQNIDPGLLEKTEGNNYKARVYPILPKAYKHIVITYEQELSTLNDLLIYELPLSITETLDEFSLNINIYEGDDNSIIKNNPYKGFYFSNNNNVYQASVIKKNHTPNAPVVVQIPNTSLDGKVLTYRDHFYAYKTLKPNTRLKTKPKKVTILWDVSYSLRLRNLEGELKLLKNYFEYLQNVEIQFISFSNRIHQNKKLSINSENWKVLEQLIRNTNYDGGTSLNLFDNLKINSDETLLFTDGLSNLGDFIAYNKNAVYAINSTVSANHEALGNISTNSGGNYLNLVRLAYTDALKLLKQETYQFLGVKHDDTIEEVYPFQNTNVTTDFSITGKFSDDASLELLFGYGGKVTNRIPVRIIKSRDTKLVKRLWAKEKLNFLKKKKEKNRDIIIELAKQNHLITDFTSMLILDRVEDYVRYRIEPPQELKEEYKDRVKEIEEEEADKQDDFEDIKEDLFDEYKDIRDWYHLKFPLKEVKKEKQDNTDTSNKRNVSSPNNIAPNNTSIIPNRQNSTAVDRNEARNLDNTKRVISGIVSDENGQPLPGVSVRLAGTLNGTSTDFDGHYALNAEENDRLEFSFIGFHAKSILIRNDNSVNVSLHEDASVLDEVVVVALASRREVRTTSYSVASVVSESLAGKVSGVQVTETPGANSTVSVRGVTSFSNNSKPLYIVDGIIVSYNPTTSLKPEDIDAMSILDAENASKIYGSRAANGIIMITTKNGKETNQEAINNLNKKIVEKIELKSWNPDTPYIKILEKELTVEAAYKKYLEIRNEYSNSPSFYLDVADFFDKNKSSQLAITILTNLIEIKLDNHELMKALAYKLEYFKQYDLAVIVYEKVLEIRPEEPQSYRDLALAYELSGEFQKSFDLLFKIYNGELLHKDEDERYYGIEHIVYVELTRLVSKYGKKLILNKTQKTSFTEIPVDVRVVIDWNHNDTDIDLWVIDPNGEKAYYSNKKTKIGGRMSEDLTEGYGPEEFMLKKAIKGNYKIMVDYYSDNVQKISGPTILKVNLFTNYGKKNEKKEVIIIRLDKEEDEIEVGNLRF